MHEPIPASSDRLRARGPLSARQPLFARRIDVARIAGIVLVCAIAAIPSFASAFGRPWTITPDHDFIAVYNALLFNAGLPQENFDFTAYPLYLALAGWFRLYEAFGLVSIADFRTLQATGSWEASFAELIAAGRVLMLVFGIAMTLTVYLILRRLVVWPAAVAMTAVFAVSQGLSVNLHLIYPGLPSALFYLGAVGALLLARRWDASLPFRLALAAGLAWLSIQTKLQTVPAVFALFLLAQFTLPTAADDPDRHDHDYFVRLKEMGPAWLFCGFIAVTPLLYEVWRILAGSGFRIADYQLVLGGFAVANMVVYWARAAAPGIAPTTLGALLGGVGVAHLLHYVSPHAHNVASALYFLDALPGIPGGAGFDLPTLAASLPDIAWFTLAGRIVEWRTLVWGACIWIGLAAAIIEVLRHRRRHALLPLALIGLALVVDMLSAPERQPASALLGDMLAVLGCACAIQHLFARTATRRVRILASIAVVSAVFVSTAINLDSKSPPMSHPSLTSAPDAPCTVTRASTRWMAYAFDSYCRPD